MERLVNERILENAPVSWQEVPYESVKTREDVMQFFGDKYGETVRVVQIGGTPGLLDGYSMELCGGTHQKDLESLAGALNSPVGELQRKVEGLILQQKQLEKQLRAVREQQAAGMASQLIDQAISLPAAGELPSCPMILADLGSIEGNEIQTTADALKASFDGVIVLVAQSGESVVLLAVSGAAWQKAYPAGKIIQTLAPLVDGKGGGKPAFARGGGKSPGKIKELIQKASALVAALAG